MVLDVVQHHVYGYNVWGGLNRVGGFCGEVGSVAVLPEMGFTSTSYTCVRHSDVDKGRGGRWEVGGNVGTVFWQGDGWWSK